MYRGSIPRGASICSRTLSDRQRPVAHECDLSRGARPLPVWERARLGAGGGPRGAHDRTGEPRSRSPSPSTRSACRASPSLPRPRRAGRREARPVEARTVSSFPNACARRPSTRSRPGSRGTTTWLGPVTSRRTWRQRAAFPFRPRRPRSPLRTESLATTSGCTQSHLRDHRLALGGGGSI